MSDKFSLDIKKLSAIIEKVNQQGITMTDTNNALKLINSIKTSKDLRADRFTNTYKFKLAEKYFTQFKKNFVPPKLTSKQFSELNDFSELNKIIKDSQCSDFNECVCVLKGVAEQLAKNMDTPIKETVELLLQGALLAPCGKGSLKKKRTKKKRTKKNKTRTKH